MAPRYRLESHTADTAVTVFGADLGELYENAAFAMFDLMVDLEPADPTGELTVEADGADPADTIINLLSELLYASEAGDVVGCRFAAEMAGPGGVRLKVATIPIGAVAAVGPPIKAVTYHELRAAETETGWEARVVFDV